MVKKTKKFNYQKDLKKKWKKEKEKKNPKINTDKLKDFWDENKSVRFNYKELGLCIDPNQTLGIPKTKKLLNPEIMNIEEAKKLNTPETETLAVKMLMEEANQELVKKYQLNENDVLFCIYLLEKHGEDYKKMARDHHNSYQETPAQLKKKIGLFKKMKPQYEKYLQDKAAGTDLTKDWDE